MKTLYESILDDEDEVMDRVGDDLINDWYKRLWAEDWFKPKQEDCIKISGNDIKILHSIDYSKNLEGFKDLFSGKLSKNIKYISRFECDELNYDRYFHNFNPHNLTVDCIGEFDVDEDFLERWDNTFKVKTIKQMKIDDVRPRKYDIFKWSDKLKNIKIKKLELNGGRGSMVRNAQEDDANPDFYLSGIKGLNIEELTISCIRFPNIYKKSVRTTEYMNTTNNEKMLDSLFQNNHIGKIIIIGYSMGRKNYFEVTKGKRVKYKLVKIK